MKKEEKKKHRIFGKIIFILLVILIILLSYKNVKEQVETIETINLQSAIIEGVEEIEADISKYIVYGTHFNIEGTLNINEDSVSDVEIVIKDSQETEEIVETEYEINDNIIEFTSGDIINEGIDLESFEQGTYYLLLKVKYETEEIKYYSFSNASEYGNIEYYTITKNEKNNKIDIQFNEYNSIELLNFNVTEVSELPDDVYDVVIDAGHGGLDTGAVSGNYYEADIVLDCALTLKSKLEDLGLKVFLTRDGTEDEEENTAYNMYDDDGRVTLAMESNAKILISLHMNSNEEDLTTGGVEVYAPSNADLTFARLLADNIVTMANTNYSYLETYKEYDGVYIHNFSESEIAALRRMAISNGYEPYDITTTTPYLYIIRETGGIATNAFVDGRNTSYSANKYYNSNIGIESYLIELGYIIVNKDLRNVINNEELYMEAIAQAIQSQYL